MRISDWSSDVCSSDLIAGQHLQADAALLQISDQPDDVRQRPSNSVELPDNKSVAITHDIDCLVEPRPFGRTARANVVEDPVASGTIERKIGRASGRDRVCQYV